MLMASTNCGEGRQLANPAAVKRDAATEVIVRYADSVGRGSW
jgi:hypothetical protein